MKLRIPVALLLITIGLFFVVSGAFIKIPDYESLEKLSLDLSEVEVVTSGKSYRVIKLVIIDDCPACYFYTYAVDKGDFHYYSMPETSKVELLMKKGEADKQSRFAWQVRVNSKMLASYKDVTSVETERRFILIGIGALFFILLGGWLYYSRDVNPYAT